MIVDSSALIAIVRAEAESAAFAAAIEAAGRRWISAASFLEVAIVVDSARDPVASGWLDDLLTRAGIAIQPVTQQQVQIGRAAYRDYGKGSGSPAQLNFGDCFAYALAKTMDEPLLFKGEDFLHTDIRPAIPPP